MDINASLIGQILTFAILVWFTMKFVWPPLTHTMDERAKRIAEGLAAAERGKQDLLDAEERVAEELAKARQEATEIVLSAERRATLLLEEAKEQAKTEGSRLINEAKSVIEQESLRAKELLRHQVAHLVVQGAEKILRQEVNPEHHKQLLESIKAEL